MDPVPETAGNGWRRLRSRGCVGAFSDWTCRCDPLRPRGPGLVPMAVELASGEIGTLAARVAAAHDGAGPPPRLVVPAGQDWDGRPAFTIYADDALIGLLEGGAAGPDPLHPGNDILGISPGLPLPEGALPFDPLGAPVALPDAPPAPGVVVMAVIDSGLPVLNQRFRDARGATRVRHFWVQDGGPDRAGRDFDAAALDALIARHSANGPWLDEIAAYREMGLADFGRAHAHPLGRAVTHGSHVADLAAGYAPEDDRTDRPIICVQLPHHVTADTTGRSLAPYLVRALDYIADRADRIASALGCGRLPLVINFSYGATGGPLDGTSLIERHMDQFIAARQKSGAPTAMLLPAGNNHLSHCHARPVAGRDFKGAHGTETLSWKIQPDDHTASFVEIWLPRAAAGAQRLSVALTTPGGEQSGFLDETPGASLEWRRDGDVVARITYDYVPAPTGRGRFTIVVQATARPGATAALAPAGVWKIALRNDGLADGAHVDAWILRDEEIPGFDTDARQSRFLHAAARHHDAPDPREDEDAADPGPIVSAGLQNVLATGLRTLVIGGYVGRSGKVARYSAGGATNTPDRPGPDALALSDDSMVHPGVIAAGVLNGCRVARGGTSAAAPQVARAMADRMAQGKAADRAALKAMARASEHSDFANRVPRPPVRRGGHGRIQLAPQNDRRYRPL